MNSDELRDYKPGQCVRVVLDAEIANVDADGAEGTLLLDTGNGFEGYVNDEAIVSIERVRKPLPEGWVWHTRENGDPCAELRHGRGMVSRVYMMDGDVCVEFGADDWSPTPFAVIDAVREASQ